MALEFQDVDVKFTDGLETRTQAKLVVPGKWLQAQNVEFATDGTPRRRNSQATLNGSATGNGLVTRAGQLVAMNGAAGTLVTTTGVTSALNGRYAYCDASASTLARTEGNQDSFDCAYGNGYIATVWRNLTDVGTVTSVHARVIEEASGAVMLDVDMRTASTVKNPRVSYNSSGQRFFFFYQDTFGPTLYARALDATNPITLGVETNLITSASLAPEMDTDFFNSDIAIVYRWADGVTSLRAAAVDVVAGNVVFVQGPINVVTEVALPTAAISAVCVKTFPLGTTLGVFTSATAGGALAGVTGWTIGNGIFALVNGPVTLDATVNPTAGSAHLTATDAGNATDLTIYVDQVSNYNAARLNQIRFASFTSALAITSAASALINSNSYRVNAAEASGPQGPWIAGKAFTLGARRFLPVSILETWNIAPGNVVTNNQQNTLFVLDGATGFVAARLLTGSFGDGIGPLAGSPYVAPCCGTPVLASGAEFVMCAGQTTRLVLSGGLNISPSGVALVKFKPRVATPAINKQLGSVALMAGGGLTQFDGTRLQEANFHLYPEGYSAVMNAGAGNVTAGVHQIVVVYEWSDDAGRRHQSAFGSPVSVTAAGAPQQVIMRIPTLQLQQGYRNFIAVPYMTEAAGTTFYRCTKNGGTIGTVANDTTVTNVQFIIQEGDSDLRQNEPLYTQPSLPASRLPNTAPPPCDAVGTFDQRLWCNATDDEGAVWFSQQNIQYTGLQWNDALKMRVDVNAGGVVGFCALDEKQIIFCERKLYAVFGTGPNAAGTNSQYSSPTEIQTDAGCTEARSILSMPMGVMFKSTKGWRLLGRDLSVRDIGDGPQAFNSQNVTSAVLMQDREECRFTSSSDASAQLVFCYRDAGQWTVNYYMSGSYNPMDAVWWQAAYEATGFGYTTVSIGDGVAQDSNGIQDTVGGTSSIVKFLKSSWLKVSSIGGFQRVRWLYLTMTCRPEGGVGAALDSDLSIGVSFDDIDIDNVGPNNYIFTVSLATVGTAALRASGIIDLRHKLRTQKCKSVQFTFAEENGATNTLLGLQALTLNVGVKRGTKKLPAGQGVG